LEADGDDLLNLNLSGFESLNLQLDPESVDPSDDLAVAEVKIRKIKHKLVAVDSPKFFEHHHFILTYHPNSPSSFQYQILALKPLYLNG
jgi:hypothetical protein